MGDSSSDVEVNQSLRSPPRRRRSTFFERRESLVPQNPTANIDDACKHITEAEGPSADLSSYYEKLCIEKEQWKHEVKSRRNKYHDLKQQYQMALKSRAQSKMSYSALSNEDIEFLKGKVNVSKLVESQVKLHNSVKVTKAMYKRASELDDVILSVCEEKLNKINEYIFENSTIEVKNRKST